MGRAPGPVPLCPGRRGGSGWPGTARSTARARNRHLRGPQFGGGGVHTSSAASVVAGRPRSRTDSCSKSAVLSHDVQPGPGRSSARPRVCVPGPAPLQLGGFRGPLRPFPPSTGNRLRLPMLPRIPGTGPLHGMRRVQAPPGPGSHPFHRSASTPTRGRSPARTPAQGATRGTRRRTVVGPRTRRRGRLVRPASGTGPPFG